MIDSTSLFPFGQLPIDLRLPIWEIFMLQECSGRLMIIDNLTSGILAVLRLLSPLLSVNMESRECATSFYGMKLPVYHVPSTSMDLIPSVHERRFAFSTRGLRAEMARNVMIQAREESTSQGIMYISPKHDIFVPSIDLVQAFYDDQFNADMDS
ncbi:hypothetical protein F5X99DRAFT_432246 [Biscogniauxia marginata]|nr:hypothetical protein F5X99DRAFT_432246 [Biscogniauxia marginata]